MHYRINFSKLLGLVPAIVTACLLMALASAAQNPAGSEVVIHTSWLFDGIEVRQNWDVHIKDGKITYAGEAGEHKIAEGVETIDLRDVFVLPGLIDAHTHVLLHPYDETNWNDQVLKESSAERVARATVHLSNTLVAGFTTIRDLGSEGSGYDDVGLRAALEKQIIQGPRMLVAGPAIVATGSYGPKGFADHVHVPLGAEEADGSTLVSVARDQIGHGVDIVKVYGDYRWGPGKTVRPTFTQGELNALVEVTKLSGRDVVAHAMSKEAMLMAAKAGVRTIEHGDHADKEVYRVMKENDVALCPTLAAVESISSYNGWNKGVDPDVDRVVKKKQAFTLALKEGVTILAGGDAGVFSHGNNVLELELMQEYGMATIDVMRAATSVNARYMGLELTTGKIAVGMEADIIAVVADPSKDISALRDILVVMQAGKIAVDNRKSPVK